ncbi:MAG: hypothetical protein VB061_08980 [Christensenella sp.]|nr:hypothetical protein [Christensenella sp.]
MKKSWKQNIQERVGTFMYGRYGMDPLSQFMLGFSLVVLILSAVLFSLFSEPSIAVYILQFAALAILMLSYFRIFSRNIEKRRRENDRYMKLIYPFRNWFRSRQQRFKMRKDYKLFTCPTCKTTLRVPRGKGRIYLTCPKCKTRFEGKS